MLALFLIYFSLFLEVMSQQAIIRYHLLTEMKLSNQLNRFSMIEMDVIHQTVKKFVDYKMDDFSLSYEEGEVSIKMIDEQAIIFYDFNEDIYAVISYDLVFDTGVDYEIVDAKTYHTIDNFKD